MFDWKPRSQFLETMPRRSMVLLLLGVACLFGAIGSIADATNMEHSTPLSFVFSVLGSGVGAVLWALIFTMGMWKTLIGMCLYQTLVFPRLMAWAGSKQPRILNTAQLRQEWVRHGVVALACIVAGYVLFIVFFRREGQRFFAAHTEIQLAAAIQAELVPAISTRSCGFEFYGVSVPSGNVGGDLLDVVTNGNSFCAYVADIAGHGVPAGVLMSMVKSAVRMRMTSVGPCDDGLLPALNEVVYPLTAPNVYATFVYVSGDGGAHLRFSVAGHLPIFHYKRATGGIERCSVENLPVGMFAGVDYKTAMLECQAGDLLAMITDGLTEIFGRDGQELGSEHVEQALAQAPGEPLSEIASRMLRTAQDFGQATDDRTLLLVRCLGCA
jgi:serine phosphatase RsbU (regulator of sigma subunit)